MFLEMTRPPYGFVWDVHRLKWDWFKDLENGQDLFRFPCRPVFGQRIFGPYPRVFRGTCHCMLQTWCEERDMGVCDLCGAMTEADNTPHSFSLGSEHFESSFH